MSDAQDLRGAVQALRAKDFADLPSSLVDDILNIESKFVDQRDIAVDQVRAVVQAEARARAQRDAEASK